MYCQKCGSKQDDNAYKCLICGNILQYSMGDNSSIGRIPNYLVQSILVTIFCCLPLGIPAIIFASQVNTKAQAGDIPGALESSRKARMFCWIAFGLGLFFQIIYAFIYIFALLAQ